MVSNTLSILHEESAGLDAKDWIVPTITLDLLFHLDHAKFIRLFPLEPHTWEMRPSWAVQHTTFTIYF